MSDAPILDPVNRVTDIDGASDFEKKHSPFVEIERTTDGHVEVRIRVGHWVAHPNQPDHFIQWISLSVGDGTVARVDLSPVVTAPDVSFAIAVAPGTVLRAMASCNLHGLWATEATC